MLSHVSSTVSHMISRTEVSVGLTLYLVVGFNLRVGAHTGGHCMNLRGHKKSFYYIRINPLYGIMSY